MSKAATTDKKPRQRAPRKDKPGDINSPIWNCKVCMDQICDGGPRCPVHNPTPEEREANPSAYRREGIAVALLYPDEQIRCGKCSWYGMAEECVLHWADHAKGSHLRLDCPRCKSYLKWAKQA